MKRILLLLTVIALWSCGGTPERAAPPLSVATTTTTTTLPPPPPTTTTTTTAAPPVTAPRNYGGWDCIAQLEVGGNWAMQGSKYSGIGFLNEAWTQWGGLEYAPNAGLATPEQQIAIGNKIMAAVGSSAWATADECGF